ncbi:unnamed protein product [Anisakis simplex]|uniref:Tubulin-specific chaperone D n=1 Tax=Anisakis simplex TaxID=6269 RepID=A0A0M3JX75_ANISI|nr:unnamed protein product [Anisakis simplex]
MQEKLLLEVVAGNGHGAADEGFSPVSTSFADVHRIEIFSIINAIPSFAYSPHKEEESVERFKTVCYMEKVLVSLEKYNDSTDLSDAHEVGYVLLLWLTILCKNPFDFKRFDSSSKGPSTVRRIIHTVMPYLYMGVTKLLPVCSLLLAIVVTREDARASLLLETIESCVKAISTCSKTTSGYNILIANLYLLTSIFKHGRRDDLLPLAGTVLRAVAPLVNVNSSDIIVKKLLIKLIQRLGVVFLKPKVSKWRYERGDRVLSVDSLKVQQSFAYSETVHEDELDDNQCGIACEELEVVLDAILRTLRDDDTTLRWSAAKGVGRVASRLPKHLANDVLSSILSSVSNHLAGHAAWHGACLAIAELARRGYLLPERIPDIVPLILKALMFEERQGRHHALGANVRDAACYICWSLARAFSRFDMMRYVPQIATSLVCVAVFDREINVRRAASAAFQENVGRQGSFPNGIEVLTMIDYFAVGMRRHAYLEVSTQVAKYPLYSRPLIEHLIDHKVSLIQFFSPSMIVISKIVPLLDDQQPIVSRQGAIMALAGALSGLSGCTSVIIDDCLFETIATIPSKTFLICNKKTNSLGGAFMRRAVSTFILKLSTVIPAKFINIVCTTNECEREGIAGLLSALPLSVYVLQGHDQLTLFTIIINTLIDIIDRPSAIDAMWACGRRACVDSLAKIVSVVGLDSLTNNDSSRLINCLINVLNDYTSDRRGDIGRLLRASGMRALRTLLPNAQRANRHCDRFDEAICKIVQQSCEKIDAIRICAAGVLNDLLLCGLENIVDREILKAVYLIDGSSSSRTSEWQLSDWGHNVCFKRLTTLFASHHYRYHALVGFIVSVGKHKYNFFSDRLFSFYTLHFRGSNESTMRCSADALLSVLNAFRDSPAQMEAFLHDLATIFSNSIGVARMIEPLLSTIEKIFSAETLSCFEQNPDSSPSLIRIIDLVAMQSANKKCKPQVLKSAVTILSHTLHLNSDSHVWHKAASVIVCTLHSSVPMLRRCAAEQLYECVASEVAEAEGKENAHRAELLNLLSSTEWQSDAKQEHFVEISRSIARILNVAL